MYNTREKIKKIQLFCKQSPKMSEQYKVAKKFINIYAHSSMYEVSHRCNLRCEGCYFFDDISYILKEEITPTEQWKALFLREKERGILMGSYFGAEPAIEQERLKLAAKYIPYGNIGTNGMIKIDEEIQLRIHISVWGGKKLDAKLRGKSAFDTALKNYAHDPRAIVAYTLSSMNIDDVEEVTKRCQDHGLPITFSMYSPAKGYTKKLQTSTPHDNQYFRISTQKENPLFTEETLLKTRAVIDKLIDKYPETVYYTHSFNHWITELGSRYTLDPDTGFATNCGSKLTESYKMFSANTEEVFQKCVHASLDCNECRVYGASASSLFMPTNKDVSSEKLFKAWLDQMYIMDKIFIYRPQK